MTRGGPRRLWLGSVWFFFVAFAQAGEVDDYHLAPMLIAPDTYVFKGAPEHFTFDNGGNIVNIGFIVTAEGVIVIDTGPSRLYGEQMRAAIGEVTDQPIRKVFITHHHPDHFLGNQAFPDVPIAALAGTTGAMRAQGEGMTTNLYSLVGGWMRGTAPVYPTEVARPGVEIIGGHRIRVIASGGHTGADLAILDETAGVLFAGDLVFYERAPTTPHAELNTWLAALDKLEKLNFSVLVPGHGPITLTKQPLEQTRDYLRWLDKTLQGAAREGLDMPEVMQLALPAWVQELAVVQEEFQRSVSHLYPARELTELAPAEPLGN